MRGVLFPLIASSYLLYNLYEDRGQEAPEWIEAEYFYVLGLSTVLLTIGGVLLLVIGRLSGGEDEEQKVKAE